MNIQEAIRTLKEFDLTEDEQNEIIELLQQGEKYKQMWEEFEKKYGNYFTVFDIEKIFISKIMDELKQKYFTKGDKITDNDGRS